MRLGLHRRIIHAGADIGFYLGWGAIFLGKSRDSCMCRWYMRKEVKEEIGYVDAPVCAPTESIYIRKCNLPAFLIVTDNLICNYDRPINHPTNKHDI